MDINPWQIFKLDTDVSWSDIEKILNVDNVDDKEKYKTIFDQIAGVDGILSQDEWNSFTKICDQNKDGNLTYTEILSSSNSKLKLSYKTFKNEIIKFYNMMKDLVSSRTAQSTEQNIEGTEQYINKPLPNKQRLRKRRTNGNFTEKWLAVDKYGSKTYKEWCENLEKDGFVFDNIAAQAIYDAWFTKYRRSGWCSKNVTDSVNTAQNNIKEELFDVNDRQNSAYQNASVYANNPKFKEIPQNIVSTMNLSDLPLGCIVIYDANYITSPRQTDNTRKYHRHGHIGISDGKGKDLEKNNLAISSDYVIENNQDTKVRIFVPVKKINT